MRANDLLLSSRNSTAFSGLGWNKGPSGSFHNVARWLHTTETANGASGKPLTQCRCPAQELRFTHSNDVLECGLLGPRLERWLSPNDLVTLTQQFQGRLAPSRILACVFSRYVFLLLVHLFLVLVCVLSPSASVVLDCFLQFLVDQGCPHQRRIRTGLLPLPGLLGGGCRAFVQAVGVRLLVLHLCLGLRLCSLVLLSSPFSSFSFPSASFACALQRILDCRLPWHDLRVWRWYGVSICAACAWCSEHDSALISHAWPTRCDVVYSLREAMDLEGSGCGELPDTSSFCFHASSAHHAGR